MNILTRTFAAKRATTEEERQRLNLDALTSQYMPSHRYVVQVPMPNHPTQTHVNHTFRTKQQAQDFIERHCRA